MGCAGVPRDEEVPQQPGRPNRKFLPLFLNDIMNASSHPKKSTEYFFKTLSQTCGTIQHLCIPLYFKTSFFLQISLTACFLGGFAFLQNIVNKKYDFSRFIRVFLTSLYQKKISLINKILQTLMFFLASKNKIILG